MTLEVIYDVTFLGIGGKFAEGQTGVFNAQKKLLESLSRQTNCRLYLAATELVPLALQFLEEHPFSRIISLPPYQEYQKLGHSLEQVLFYLERSKNLKFFHWLIDHLHNRIEKILNKRNKTSQGFDIEILKKSNIYHTMRGYPPSLVRSFSPRVVITLHDIMAFITPHLSPPSCIRLANKLRSHMQPSDILIASSHFVREQIIKHLKWPATQVFTVHLGISEEFQIPQSLEDIHLVKNLYGIGEGPYFLSVGRQDTRKNFLHLIKAFLGFEKHCPDTKLVLVGPASEASVELAPYFHHPSIIWTGFIPEKDLSALYQGALAYVHPSFAEGFGLPIIEAMAAGTPVITTKMTSLPEIAGDAALFVSLDDESVLSKALFSIRMSPELCLELKDKGLKQAKPFTWERAAKETLAVYQKVAA